MDRKQRCKQLAAKRKRKKDAIRRQNRKEATYRRKVVVKAKRTWENQVVAAFVSLGWTKGEVRSHMKYIDSLGPSVSAAIKEIKPIDYVNSLIQGFVKQSEKSK